jgi:acyl-CoA synthetase (NDP forming)
MPERSNKYLLEPAAIRLLAQYQIPYPDHRVAHDAEEAVLAAEKLGYPVVLKVISPRIIHKSDVGGVLVNLASEQAVRQGYEQIIANAHRALGSIPVTGTLVCQQAPDGLEVIVGGVKDATFGPVVMVGMGGIFAELFQDVVFRVAPLHLRDAEAMIKEIKGYPLLTGMRGRALLDVDALAELLLAVSALISEHSEIAELDLNPVRLYEHSVLALDARVLIQEQAIVTT